MAPTHSKRSPAFQFYPSDFFSSAKVDRMPMTERGAYITLLARCWLDDGLSTDLGELASICRMKPPAFERMWKQSQIGKCFVERGGKFRNVRLDQEHQKQVEYRRRQSDHGKRGGRPVTKGSKSQPLSDKQGSQSSPISSSSLISSSSSSSGGKDRPPQRTPIHTSHATHVACGRVCLHSKLFDEFVRRRNHDGAHAEVLHFADVVIKDWTTGVHANDEPGDEFAFWRARYSERWPAASVSQSKPKPAWYKPAGQAS